MRETSPAGAPDLEDVTAGLLGHPLEMSRRPVTASESTPEVTPEEPA